MQTNDDRLRPSAWRVGVPAIGPEHMSPMPSPHNDELSQRTMSMMDRQLSQMIRLVEDLLDVSRFTRGHIMLKRERMCLTEALATAIESARPHLEAQGHELAIDMRAQPPLYVDADRTRLSQVFSNLLSNSAKYTDPGGIVTLTVDRQGEEVVTCVRDTGIGIPANALEDVFDLFAQVRPQDSRSPKPSVSTFPD